MLRVKGLKKWFGGLLAVNDYSIHLKRGEIVGLIGPNGAGKTTIFNLITGVLRPSGGKVLFKDRDITGMKPDRIASTGIIRTFQNVRLFRELTVEENLKIAYHTRHTYHLFDVFLSSNSFRREEKRLLEDVNNYLKLLNILEFREYKAEDLPYGIQKRVEIARALMLKPELLLMDEPAAGLNPNETEEIMELVLRVKEMFDLSILLIEHDMKMVMGICERIQVLNRGELIAEGTPEEVQNNPQVIEAYLGRRRVA